ncbi:hypothetical protein [Vibrio cholerae]
MLTSQLLVLDVRLSDAFA